jgi:hypothetical protein
MPVGGQRQFQFKNTYSASCKFSLFLHALLEFPKGQGDVGRGTEAVPAIEEQLVHTRKFAHFNFYCMQSYFHNTNIVFAQSSVSTLDDFKGFKICFLFILFDIGCI